MALNFDKYKNQGNRFIKELSIELGYPGETERTGRILKSVLHTLRNHLTVEQSLKVLSNLPMFLKGIYVEDWQNVEKKKVKDTNDFLLAIWKEDGFQAEEDFENLLETEHFVIMVFHVLRKYISKEELNELTESLPEEIKPLFKPVYVV